MPTIAVTALHTLAITFLPRWLTELRARVGPVASRVLPDNFTYLRAGAGRGRLRLPPHLPPPQPSRSRSIPSRYPRLVVGRDALAAVATGRRWRRGTASRLPLLQYSRGSFLGLLAAIAQGAGRRAANLSRAYQRELDGRGAEVHGAGRARRRLAAAQPGRRASIAAGTLAVVAPELPMDIRLYRSADRSRAVPRPGLGGAAGRRCRNGIDQSEHGIGVVSAGADKTPANGALRPRPTLSPRASGPPTAAPGVAARTRPASHTRRPGCRTEAGHGLRLGGPHDRPRRHPRHPPRARLCSATATSRPTPTTACTRCAPSRTSRSPARPIADCPELVDALACVKQAAALANRDLGLLDDRARRRHRRRLRRDPRRRAARPVRRRPDPGRRRHLDQHERQRGDRQPRARDPRRTRRATTRACTRTTHVNLAQSTNDVYPTALKIARPGAGIERLIEAMAALRRRFADEGRRSSPTS